MWRVPLFRADLPAATLPHDLPTILRRGPKTSKRNYGRVVLVGGSAGMAGAPALAAMAALRSGAGLVEVLVPEPIVTIVASFDPCLMTRGFPAEAEGTFSSQAFAGILARIKLADAVAVGPGIGRCEAVSLLVQRLWSELPQPAVFDADALWALAQLDHKTLSQHAGPRVLTPHAGEMLRLLSRDPAAAIENDRRALEESAVEMARAIGAVIVLKGSATLVVDATQQAHNETGNPGMATGGTGDVLTGIVAALMAQHFQPFAAARLAAWVHGRAGDIAAFAMGEISMTARDLLDALPIAFCQIQSQ